MAKMKKAAVIGAGLCGLGFTTVMKQEGFEPVCFERSGDIGGLWRYHDDDVNGIASVMKTTIINTSKELGAFSTFPPPAEYPNYMHNSLMYEYIKKAADKADFLKYVRFHHETVKIEKADDYEVNGRWKVTCKNKQTGELVTEEFDFVGVCIGHHVYPNEPTFPGQDEFQGKIMHTHSLKNVDGFDNLRVVIVGAGNSAVDAAVEISSVAKNVYISSRRGTWVFPRVGPGGQPNDTKNLRRIFHILKQLFSFNIVCSFVERELNARFDHETYNIKPKHRALSQHPTVSDILPIKLLSGTVVFRGNIKRFTKNGVIFEGEEEETEADVVVLATGYKIQFPFLSDDIVRVDDNRVELYKFIFPPELPHSTLAILALVQPLGPGIPVGEMQCRWAARVMKGKIKLPSKEEMYADIKRREKDMRKKFVDSPRHTLEVDFIGYQDELAEEIGCKPNLWKLAITDPKLFWAIMFGPSLPYQYRLQGPYPWEGARDAILTYKERIIAPFQRPGGPYVKRDKGLLNKGFNILLVFFLPLMAYILFNIIFCQ